MDAKRKRRVKKGCPNPLFVKWLQEWKDEAVENGWKSSYTYNKVGDMFTIIVCSFTYLGMTVK